MNASSVTRMQRILFGDNQFFGVNHMSEEKARAQSIQFQEISSIISVLETAYDAGIRVFMCTTHERMAEVCDVFRANQDRFADFEFYPCMPYAHKYANAVSEDGLVGALQRFLPASNPLGALVKGGLSVATKDVEGIAELLVEAELKMFHGLKTPVVFIQNVVTDLLLGLGVNDAFRIFRDIVRDKHNAEAGFITMNTPRLLDVLDSVGIENPIVCSNINKIGFRMSGGVPLYEETLRTRRFRPIAMSVFASGAVPAAEAIRYVSDLPIESIVFGASSAKNIQQTTRLIEEMSPKAA